MNIATDLKLLKYNREFAGKFLPKEGVYCYEAYKNRSQPCEICPVMRAFEDGKPHFSEEKGIGKDGAETYWHVRAAPVKNDSGEVIAAIEMCLDVTQMKFLEREVKKS